MKALINKNTNRILQVQEDTFPVASGLEWVIFHIIYPLDNRNVWTGEQQDIDTNRDFPPLFSITAPPELTGDQVAKWFDGAWKVLDSYPVTLDAEKAKKLAELTAYAKQYLSAAMNDYSEWEAISWPILIQEAEQFAIDGTIGEYMAAEIGVKYPTAADLAAVILQRKEVMKQLRAGVILVRQQKEAQIEAAQTIEDLNAINIQEGWPV